VTGSRESVPAAADYRKDIDLTLIRQNLGRSVDERFQMLHRMRELQQELQQAVREAERRQ
jgi:hypothetical protein